VEFIEISIVIQPYNKIASEVIMAEMSQLDFDSFIETQNGFKAYIESRKFDIDELKSILEKPTEEFGEINYKQKSIKQQNWNREWEKSFKPIVIRNECIIRALFHEINKNYKYNILIEPKMAFGTGHHATTSMMLEHILEIDIDGKEILDMGTGTGVLSILASLRGAKSILAIDNDTWAFNNCVENLKMNNISNVKALEGDSKSITGNTFDIILANINRNTLINDFWAYANALNKKGKIILSGFYVDDINAIEQKANSFDLFLKHYLEKENWASIILTEK